jgi:hypothetical protein
MVVLRARRRLALAGAAQAQHPGQLLLAGVPLQHVTPAIVRAQRAQTPALSRIGSFNRSEYFVKWT